MKIKCKYRGEMMSNTLNYDELTAKLAPYKLGITAAELHGFLSGILAGGNHDDSWQPLTEDMLNDGQPIPKPLLELFQSIYKKIETQFAEDDFEFQLLLSDRDLFARIDDLIGWVNYFLLGIGLIQPQLTKVKGDVGEAIYDLRQIVKLGYDPEDDQEELGFAFEEIQEYVRITAILCYDEFNEPDVTPTIH
ncbi:YecA family protein [Orbaceae bacterium ESL0721]|nr:YecA family protein [Orbaceae bacterium ESL0721]